MLEVWLPVAPVWRRGKKKQGWGRDQGAGEAQVGGEDDGEG